MARMNQLNPNDYTSSAKVNDDIRQLVEFLQTTEIGGYTLPELLLKIFSTGGAIKSTFVEFQYTATHLQYRTGGGAWVDLVPLSDITGPAGPSGSGTGDMVRSTYDPDSDGKIAYAQMLFADGDIPQAKVSGLAAALLASVDVEISATQPSSPTYPPAGPVTWWLDISTPTSPVWKFWDGVSTWITLGGSTTAASTDSYMQVIAGESIASRDLCFLATRDHYGDNQCSGGTAFSSAGTAANAFDGNTATQCDTAATNGHVGYTFAAAKTIRRVELYFPAGANSLGLIFETSPNGTTWTQAHSVASVSYTGATWAHFDMVTPNSATRIRVRQSGGATNMSIVEMVCRERELQKGRAYKVNDTVATVRRKSDIVGIALDNGTLDNRFRMRVAPGLIDGMTLSGSNLLLYSGTTGGALTSTPNKLSTLVGESFGTTQLNFQPGIQRKEVGQVDMFMGAINDLPYDHVLLDGRQLSRTQYPVLFAKWGTLYGAGDGQTTFTLPDMRDKFVLGAKQDDSSVAKTNYTGSLTTTGGARAAQITSGGGGSNVAETGAPTGALQTNLDPPYYAAIYAVKVG